MSIKKGSDQHDINETRREARSRLLKAVDDLLNFCDEVSEGETAFERAVIEARAAAGEERKAQGSESAPASELRTLLEEINRDAWSDDKTRLRIIARTSDRALKLLGERPREGGDWESGDQDAAG